MNRIHPECAAIAAELKYLPPIPLNYDMGIRYSKLIYWALLAALLLIALSCRGYRSFAWNNLPLGSDFHRNIQEFEHVIGISPAAVPWLDSLLLDSLGLYDVSDAFYKAETDRPFVALGHRNEKGFARFASEELRILRQRTGTRGCIGPIYLHNDATGPGVYSLFHSDFLASFSFVSPKERDLLEKEIRRRIEKYTKDYALLLLKDQELTGDKLTYKIDLGSAVGYGVIDIANELTYIEKPRLLSVFYDTCE